MNELVISGGRMVTPEGIVEGGAMKVSGLLISSIGESYMGEVDIQLPDDWMVVPGFIDLHLHGAAGADVMDASVEALQKIQQSLLEEGTTAFLATTITHSREAILSSLHAVQSSIAQQRAGAEILGVHLEGPYISPQKAGAQPLEHIRPFDVNEWNNFQEAAQGAIRVVTFAPEILGGEEFAVLLREQDVVLSLGHTAATSAETQLFLEFPRVQATHLFNQMTGLHHRDVGMAGAFLLHPTHPVEVIADGIHVSDDMLKLIYRLKGSQGIMLITDSIRAKRLPDGISELGGQPVYMEGGVARLADGTLAGSTLSMNEAFRRIVQVTGCSEIEAVEMTSSNAARQLGLSDVRGSLEAGKLADICILDAEYNVQMTMCRGEITYRRGGDSHDGGQI